MRKLSAFINSLAVLVIFSGTLALFSESLVAKSSQDSPAKPWKTEAKPSQEDNNIAINQKWWDERGNPAINAFRDCVVSETQRNFSGKMSLEGLLSSATRKCRRVEEEMRRVLAAAYPNSRQLRSAMKQTFESAIAPAAKQTYEEMARVEKQNAEELKKKKNASIELASECTQKTTKRLALYTNEDATSVTNAVITICSEEIDSLHELVAAEAARRDGLRNPSGAELAKRKKAMLEDFLRPTIFALVLDIRATDKQKRSDASDEETERSGTGFYVSQEGYIATNEHVVRGCQDVEIYNVNRRKIHGAVIRSDPKKDLALVKTHAPPQTIAKFRGGRAPREGEDVVVFGFPLTDILSESGNVVTGLLTALSGGPDNESLLQFSAPIQHGNSGGPLLNKRGQVIGVVVSKLNVLLDGKDEIDVPQNVNFAIWDNVLTDFLMTNQVSFETEDDTAPLMDVPSVAAVAKSFTVQIVCSQISSASQ